jgi:hypothetical protein
MTNLQFEEWVRELRAGRTPTLSASDAMWFGEEIAAREEDEYERGCRETREEFEGYYE